MWGRHYQPRFQAETLLGVRPLGKAREKDAQQGAILNLGQLDYNYFYK
jgi:hypothetical protein